MDKEQGPDTLTPGAAPRPQAGRPRDPKINRLAVTAALELYARVGWHGFTFDALARTAGVGKPALYRRWASPADLLVEAFVQWQVPIAADCGSFRADLIDYGAQFAAWYTSTPERARISARLSVDRWQDEGLAALYDQHVRKPRMKAARDLTNNAIRRGEIETSEEALVAIEVLIGAVHVHWTFTRDADLPRLAKTFPAHIESVVDLILNGLPAVRHPARREANGLVRSLPVTSVVQ